MPLCYDPLFMPLTIREEQMAVFRAQALSRNLSKIFRQFEEIFPRHFREMGVEGSRAFIQATVNQGLKWGIRKSFRRLVAYRNHVGFRP